MDNRMFNLTLSPDERRCIDKIGTSLFHGDNLRDLLTDDNVLITDKKNNIQNWYCGVTLDFQIPGDILLEIVELLGEDDFRMERLLDCTKKKMAELVIALYA